MSTKKAKWEEPSTKSSAKKVTVSKKAPAKKGGWTDAQKAAHSAKIKAALRAKGLSGGKRSPRETAARAVAAATHSNVLNLKAPVQLELPGITLNVT